jgi:hypothetical protein
LIKQIPLKFKIDKAVQVKKKDGTNFLVFPEYVDWYYLESIGVINEEIRTFIEMLEGLVHDPLHGHKVSLIMGNEKWLRKTQFRQPELF